jgi:hypothetical protein
MNVNVLVLWLLVWLTLSRLSSGATILNAVAPHIHEDSAPPPLLYFLHIHKTSGTHLAHTLARFNPDDVCRLTQAEPMIDIPSPNPRKHEPRSYEMGFLYKNRHYLAHVCHAEQALVDASMQILAAELARIDQASQEGHHVVSTGVVTSVCVCVCVCVCVVYTTVCTYVCLLHTPSTATSLRPTGT